MTTMRGAAVLAAVPVLLAVGANLLFMKSFPVHTSGSILVTGASSGIGRDAAVTLSRKGFKVFAGVRKAADGESLRAEAPEIVPVILDVVSAEHIHNAYELILAADSAGSPLIGLVNNAGITLEEAPIEHTSIDTLKAVFDVNYFGAVAVTQRLIPLLKKNKGRIVNISSVTKFLLPPIAWPYACSKAALEAFSDVLRRELRRWHVSTSIIQPGYIATKIFTQSDLGDAGKPWHAEYQPEYDAIVRSFRAGARLGRPPSVTSEAIVHALTARYPKTRYPVAAIPDTSSMSGSGIEIPAWVLALATSVMPDRVQDFASV